MKDRNARKAIEEIVLSQGGQVDWNHPLYKTWNLPYLHTQDLHAMLGALCVYLGVELVRPEKKVQSQFIVKKVKKNK